MHRLGSLAPSLSLVASLALVGCVTEPAVRLNHANLVGATPAGVRFDLVLEVENRNAFDVEVRSVQGQPIVAGSNGIAPIAIEPRQWLRAGTETLVPVVVTVPWPVATSIAAQALTEGEIGYRFVGYADVTATQTFQIRKDRYPIDIEGELPAVFWVRTAGGRLQLGVGR